MPLKRRVRHGSNSSSSHVIKPAALIANNNLPVSATALKQNGSGLSKQQQQLDRNNYLSSLTKDQLKVECRKRGQKTTGNKTELVLTFYLILTKIVLFVGFIVVVWIELIFLQQRGQCLHVSPIRDTFLFRSNLIQLSIGKSIYSTKKISSLQQFTHLFIQLVVWNACLCVFVFCWAVVYFADCCTFCFFLLFLMHHITVNAHIKCIECFRLYYWTKMQSVFVFH